MSFPQPLMRFLPALRRGAAAQADLSGSRAYPNLRGTVRFYPTPQGVLVLAEVFGLPTTGQQCENGVFAMHVHSGCSCTGTADDPFADALTHYNPQCCPHPAHAGDMPPLIANNGYAMQAFLTDGKTVIIHDSADDFISQPAGNAGAKIACGVIRKIDRC